MNDVEVNFNSLPLNALTMNIITRPTTMAVTMNRTDPSPKADMGLTKSILYLLGAVRCAQSSLQSGGSEA